MSGIVIENGYRFEKYTGNDTRVILPDAIEGRPLTVIGAKAFLSCRNVERLVLPDSLEQVEDWAFAHMKGLEELVFPAKDIAFGKKVFLGCTGLKRIVFSGAGNQYEGISYFLASVAALMEDVPLRLGLASDREGQWKWLEEYDRMLERYLARPDTYGFEPAFIGWFNVEDVDDQQEAYIRKRRQQKAELVFQRLLYPDHMAESMRQKLADYLLGRQEKDIPALILSLFESTDTDYGNHVCYLRIWQEIGGFEIYSPQFLLERMPYADPEVRAFLMESRLSRGNACGFFETLEL